MKLKRLIKSIEVLNNLTEENLDLEIKNISFSSKQKNEKGAYFCLVGESSDGHSFYKEAIKNGAVVLFVEKMIENCSAVQVLVKDTREVLSICSCNFFGNPSKKLKMIGITGTNGKTTTSFIIRHILKSAGKKVGVIGTEGIYMDEIKLKNNMTTPDPIDLNRALRDMVKLNMEYCIMEVSAHAIHYKKIAGIKFEEGIFTNLSQDHLDFFKDLKTYGEAKAKFLTKKYCKKVIINGDDMFGQKLINTLKIYKTIYGINNICDIFAIDIKMGLSGSQFYLNLFDRVENIFLPLPCLYNIYNFLAAATCIRQLGFDSKTVAECIKTLPSVKGRFDVMPLSNGNKVIVDFAHTPDGISKVLDNVSNLAPNSKIITVFGCGGNRDKLKRPIMGKIASEKSNFVIVTSDNPRLEDANKIIEDITNGIQNKNYKVIEDRTKAIQFALTLVKNNDIVLILGKGAEPYQDIYGVKVPYSDYDVVNEYLKNKNTLKEEIQC